MTYGEGDPVRRKRLHRLAFRRFAGFALTRCSPLAQGRRQAWRKRRRLTLATPPDLFGDPIFGFFEVAAPHILRPAAFAFLPGEHGGDGGLHGLKQAACQAWSRRHPRRLVFGAGGTVKLQIARGSTGAEIGAGSGTPAGG